MFRLTSLLLCIAVLLCSCAVAPLVKNQYTFTTYHTKVYNKHPRLPSIYVSMPESVAGLETEQMIYRKVPYETGAFIHNVWSNTPAEMLYPLIVQSLNDTHAFRVVSAGSHAESFQYRLNTDILKMIQNYLVTPSQMQVTISAIITDTSDGKPVASKLFRYQVRCPSDTPYGGVVAANQIIARFTSDLAIFAVTAVAHHAGR
ncbi:MAG: ABC-type transport auxiliary lipoprotein family protein [Gammaproteobacteria bacterium]|nr:ABC-type transport auxiliary lipoprotein family protein [Gammaproteobacteria bacterium]